MGVKVDDFRIVTQLFLSIHLHIQLILFTPVSITARRPFPATKALPPNLRFLKAPTPLSFFPPQILPQLFLLLIAFHHRTILHRRHLKTAWDELANRAPAHLLLVVGAGVLPAGRAVEIGVGAAVEEGTALGVPPGEERGVAVVGKVPPHVLEQA